MVGLQKNYSLSGSSYIFVQMIPPLRPVLLVLDGHGSHITIDVIEYARSNEVYLLCLPSHTSHILQPLDVGVSNHFFQGMLSVYGGREDILAALVSRGLRCTGRHLLSVEEYILP